MLIPLLAGLFALAAAGPADPDDLVYDGSKNQLEAQLPRVEQPQVTIDGDLSDPAWLQAAVLTGFTQSEPAEGAPASERTEVRLFYTPSALYIGIRASVRDPAALRATLADRDKIERDDNIQVLLDTFNDRRRAYIFSVNALGIQQDGIYTEGGGRREERSDLSADFLFESRGRVTADGYETEIRIPFKSLKFPSGEPQSWGLNVIRSIAATGGEESWAPIQRGQPSRLAQSGVVTGISELDPGRLLEVNPTLTGKRVGSREDDIFRRDGVEGDAGLNVRYGITSNFTLNATINPDFSQIEADAGQITTNERFAIRFPEKRPFFLEGADIFNTPEPLVYTRSIIDPIGGIKLTGKAGSTNVAYLGALDDSPLSGLSSTYAPNPSRAMFNLGRLQRDVGDGSTVGALVTDREAEGEFNRVGGVDGRIRFGGAYTLQFQAAGSWTKRWVPSSAGGDTAIIDGDAVAVAAQELTGHLVQASVDRSGRNYGFRMQVKDIPGDFRASSGYLRRRDVTDFFMFQRLNFFGPPGARLESWGANLFGNRIYPGRSFWDGGGADEGMLSLRFNLNLRGNTRIEFGGSNKFFVLDPARYDDYAILLPDGSQIAGDALVASIREMRGLGGLSVQVRSSYFKSVSFNTELQREETPIFAEGTRGVQWSAEAGAEARPTGSLRLESSIRHALIERQNGSEYSQATLLRGRAEYQLSRAVFLRAVGQYSLEDVDSLRAPGGIPYLFDDAPFRIRSGDIYSAGLPQTNPLRVDLLFSYQPSPGTVFFLGYSREMLDNEAFRFSPLEPRADGLFLKLSYLFRS